MDQQNRRAGSAAAGMALAVAALAAVLLVFRFGVRGRVPVRLLARSLHRPARVDLVLRVMSSMHTRMYRRTHGRLLRWWFGAPVLVIETTGRRSGRTRRTTIMYIRDGTKFVVTPAAAGIDRVPNWWLNLRETGEGAVLVGGERRPVRAEEALGDERDRLWQQLVEAAPANAEYQTLTSRRFPVVVLEPKPEGQAVHTSAR